MLGVEKLIYNQVFSTTQDGYLKQTYWLNGKILAHQMIKLQKFFTDFCLHSILAPGSTRWWYRAKKKKNLLAPGCLSLFLKLIPYPFGNSSTTTTSATTLLHYSRMLATVPIKTYVKLLNLSMFKYFRIAAQLMAHILKLIYCQIVLV